MSRSRGAFAIVFSIAVGAQQATAQGASPSPVSMGQTIDGISCDAQEGQRIHIHQHLVIFDQGKQIDIPANIGRPGQCIYWLHTHTPDGIIHIEAPLNRSFTLGDFFSVWEKPLSRSTAASAHAAKGETLKVWVNGEAYTGDPSKIKLLAHTDIVIEVGPPFPKPPRFTAWGTM